MSPQSDALRLLPARRQWRLMGGPRIGVGETKLLLRPDSFRLRDRWSMGAVVGLSDARGSVSRLPALRTVRLLVDGESWQRNGW